ncbi:MAG TPA: aminotransferase class I/II-fold pyridoxal phosphate-dependent enzyme [Planctomycetota bacterium]|nr:aminotransferase class I/II-fold pyridoxal phosphate-dependent enzyme [Planctomycetota bacterium]
MSDEGFITFGSPIIDAEAVAAVTRTLESCWIGTGPRVHELEGEFARYVGATHALATSSCTAALHLAMVATGIGPGDEVITTPMTFCATANSIVHTGATPVFADCRRDTMNIDPAAVEAAVTPRTKAIIPVHFAGRPVDMEAILAIAKRHGLLVIEDAAHAIESATRGPVPIQQLSRVRVTAATASASMMGLPKVMKPSSLMLFSVPASCYSGAHFESAAPCDYCAKCGRRSSGDVAAHRSRADCRTILQVARLPTGTHSQHDAHPLPDPRPGAG